MTDSRNKLILPTEFKLCATCSYWDGGRQYDADLGVVVVEPYCQGECLVQSACLQGLTDVKQMSGCQWESLEDDNALAHPDEPAAS